MEKAVGGVLVAALSLEVCGWWPFSSPSDACRRTPRVYLRVTPAPLKIIVEKHPDGYVAYPLGLARGVIVGQGDSYDEALADVRSAIAFHVETFGPESLAAVDGRLL